MHPLSNEKGDSKKRIYKKSSVTPKPTSGITTPAGRAENPLHWLT